MTAWSAGGAAGSRRPLPRFVTSAAGARRPSSRRSFTTASTLAGCSAPSGGPYALPRTRRRERGRRRRVAPRVCAWRERELAGVWGHPGPRRGRQRSQRTSSLKTLDDPDPRQADGLSLPLRGCYRIIAVVQARMHFNVLKYSGSPSLGGRRFWVVVRGESLSAGGVAARSHTHDGLDGP